MQGHGQPALDFRKQDVYEYAPVTAENHTENQTENQTEYQTENHNGDHQQITRQFWREFFVYIAVIIVLVLFNSLVRIVDETQTPVTELRDVARFLFPHLNNTFSPVRRTSTLHIKGREDIQSFAFDLGGSTCACFLQWDIQQYWQRVFYGIKYIVFYCTTSFFGTL